MCFFLSISCFIKLSWKTYENKLKTNKFPQIVAQPVDKFKFTNPNGPSISKGEVLHMKYVVDGIVMTSHNLGFSKFEHVPNV